MISFYKTTAILDALFDLLLYVYDKQLRSCRDGQFLNHIVPWPLASLLCPFFHQ